MPRRWGVFGLALLFALTPLTSARAQVEPESPASGEMIRLYMDCNVLACFDMNYFRREIPFVSWVRAPQDADLYLLITAQRTGAGGMSSELIFMGQEHFDGMADTLTYVSLPNSSTDAQRQGLVGMLKIGLMRYVGLTPIAQELEIGLRPPEISARSDRPGGRLDPTAAPEEDPWDFWVFSVTGGGSLSGETTRTIQSFNGSVTANRVTEDWKLSFRISSSYNEINYETQGIPKYIRRDHTFTSTIVKALARKWSAGLRASARSSTFYNYDFAGSLSPVLEYSFFPYEESSRRGVTLQYSVDAVYNDYREETLFFKTEESFLAQSLSLGVGYTQPWGKAYGLVQGGAHLEDFDKHHASVSGSLRLRLSRALSLNLYGSYSRVQDRISVAAQAGLTVDDVLLRRRQLQTDYTYRTSIGLTYRFGSIFNNVVNPRMDGPGGGGIIMFM